MAPPRKPVIALCAASLAAVATLAAGAPVAAASAISPASPATPGAEEAGTLYWIGLAVIVALVVAVNAALLFAVRRYRSERGTEPRQVSAAPRVQARAGGVLALLAVAIFVAGVVFTERARDLPATGPAGLERASATQPLEIDATGQQWLWRYDYPNDAYSYYRLVIPVDTTVRLSLTSTDVVHSWFVPGIGKRDAVPNKTNRITFRADEEGTYEGQSAAFSGAAYATMRTAVEVVSPQEYQRYLKQLETDLETAQAEAAERVESGDLE